MTDKDSLAERFEECRKYAEDYFHHNSFYHSDSCGCSKKFYYCDEKDFCLKTCLNTELDTPNENIDYHYLNREVYNFEGVPADLKRFFAEEICLGKITDCRGVTRVVYCQEYVPNVFSDCDEKDFPSDESQEISSEEYDFDPDEGLFIAYLVDRGESEYTINRLLSFFDKQEINDIHDGNWGLLNGEPVLFDYSGY